MTTHDQVVQTVALATFVVVGFLALDGVVPWMLTFEASRHLSEFERISITGLVLGFCIGQLNLIATWAAFAPGNIMLRLPWAFLLTVSMWYAHILGNRANSYFSLDQAVFLGVVLLGGCLVAQAPLWIASRLAGVRLVQGQRAVSEKRQFRLLHLLLAMVLLSLALAPLRAILPPGDSLWRRDLPVGEVVLTLGAVALCNLLVTVPCVWGAFLPVRMLLPVAVGWTLYCAVLTALETAFFIAVSGGPPDKFDIFWALYVSNLVQCLVVFGVLLPFRAVGFDLVRVKRQAQEVES